MRERLSWQSTAVALFTNATSILGSDGRKWQQALTVVGKAPLMIEQHARKHWLQSGPAGVERAPAIYL